MSCIKQQFNELCKGETTYALKSSTGMHQVANLPSGPVQALCFPTTTVALNNFLLAHKPW